MHRVAFVIDQKQDFFLSLAWARLLRRFHPDAPLETWAILVKGVVYPEFEPYVDAFDRVEVLDGPYVPGRAELRRIPSMAARIRRFKAEVRALGLRREDVVVAYSFREFVLNTMIAALDERPRLVRIRGCNHALERRYTRRRPLVSAYQNAWNRAFGHSAFRYRWAPDSNRHGTRTYLRDPYDDEFCVTTVDTADPGQGRLAWPFPVLREAYVREHAGARPTIVFLGEIYPLVEGMPMDEFLSFLSGVLAAVRSAHPEHRHVFKPRSTEYLDGLDLTGWEIAFTDDIVESLVLREPGIEKVMSFKSSGSLVASLYGCEGCLLYPLLDLPTQFRAMLDDYFADYRGSVTFVDDLEQIAAPQRAKAEPASAERVGALARPLVELLADPRRAGA